MLIFSLLLFNQGLGYSSLNTARSALSAILVNDHGLTIGNFASVKRFLKGVFELRPPTPRYGYIWDANIVLGFLTNFYPLEDMPLSYLTYKLVMLLALATAQRAQTLHSINVDDIIYGNDLVVIPIIGILKHTTPKNRKLSLRLESYQSCAPLCVVATLKEYVRRTERLRRDERKLFISFHKPHAAVSKTTISRWLKRVLEESGIDTHVFAAHSTRSAACARYNREGKTVDEILNLAGWSNNTTFAKFYDKVILLETL